LTLVAGLDLIFLGALAVRYAFMNISFIGGGNMASAMIGGLLQQGWNADAIRVIEIAPAVRERLVREFKIATAAAVTAESVAADCIVLAIKPQQMLDVARVLRPYLSSQLVISIAAGIRLRDLARWLGGYSKLVRVMPNTPALVRAGISGLCAAPSVSDADRTQAAQIMGAVGAIVWLETEAQIDAVTAISGSGPAYVFYFIEALQQAAVDLGFDAAVARHLALQTFAGSVQLARQSEEEPALLRARVTSKGGTTERAIAVMDAESLRAIVVRARRR
jgi:pyrroline-5-carboxylate reductase